MKLVLLSGGSGKRLWPLSNDSRSKQFLKVLAAPDGKKESMVQRVWRQLQQTGLDESAYIATSKSQVEMIQSQVGATVNVIVEPQQRDTFPAIALAATYLYTIEDVRLDEVVTFLPVDPYVETGFFDKIRDLEKILQTSDAELALMGVRPTYPSAKYGYIVPETNEDARQEDFRKVSHFREKPPESEAKQLIERQALWNCGVFAFRLGYLINLLIEKGLPIQYEEMVKQYASLKKVSFDYEVVERAEHIVVTPYEGSWKDLGTWNTLTEEMETGVIGTGTVEDARNTHLVNELQVPVVVLGVDNAVVAASPDGILVSDKSASPRIKEVLKGMEARPMYEERRWGHYRVVDYVDYGDGRKVLTKRICLLAGRNLSYQYHRNRSEVWTVLTGEGEFVLNEQFYSVGAGDVLQIPPGARHSLRAVTDMELIEVQSGSELSEEDIVRLHMSWEEITGQYAK